MLLILCSQLALAAGPVVGEEFKGEGRMLTFKFVPGDKVGKLFVFGKKQAEIDLRKDHKLISITALGQGKSEELVFKESGDSYEVQNVPKWKEPFELSIRSQLKNQTEEIKVKIQRKN